MVSARKNYEAGLEDCRVLDLADDRGAFCGRMLGDFGADVIKIEPVSGDPSRQVGPFYHNAAGPDNSLYWYTLNTNKRGITLDIEKPEGQEIFKSLVGSANIVIESFSPGYMARLGLGYDSLRQIKGDIIMTSISPYGQDGPYSQYQSCDLVADAMSGFMYMIGDPDRAPLRIGQPQLYMHAGGQAGAATFIAYHHWENTGEGQYIDVSMHGAITPGTFNAVGFWDLLRQILPRSGPYRQGMSQTSKQLELWECKDGFVVFILLGGVTGARTNQRLVEFMAEENQAPPLLREMDWDKFDQANADPAFIERIDKGFASFFMAHTMQELFAGAKKYKIMLTSVSTPKEIMECPQLEARQFWQQVNHPVWGQFGFPGSPAQVSSGPLGVRRNAPRLGEHNEDVYLKELGLAPARIAALKEARVI